MQLTARQLIVEPRYTETVMSAVAAVGFCDADEHGNGLQHTGGPPVPLTLLTKKSERGFRRAHSGEPIAKVSDWAVSNLTAL